MDNNVKIEKLIELSNIVLDYIQKESFFDGDIEYTEKIKNVKDKLENRKFTVSIIAAMKAGKSTTLNALIGRDLLPNERAACTASITEIRHSKKISDCIVKKYTDGTEENIMARDGKSLEECFHEDVRESRKKDSVQRIEKYYVETPIKALEGTKYEDLIQNFVLVDTPGPNEADVGDFDVTILQRLALEQLRNSDALIMLLDYESYKSETNAKILKDIFENRDDLEKEQDKVYFLLNKIDSMGSKDGTIEEVLDSVKALIEGYTKVIKNPKVYGFSGKQAMLARAVINGTATEEMKKQMEVDYGSRFPVIITSGDREFKAIPKAEDFADRLLDLSRIEIIEQDIISEVFNSASIGMIENATKRIEGVSTNIAAKADSKIMALNKTSDEIRELSEKASGNIIELRNKSESIRKITTEKLEKIEESIYERLVGLEDKVQDVLQEQMPEEDEIFSEDKDVLQERKTNIELNCLNAVKICLTGEMDKIQRECTNVQNELNNTINIEFNNLVREATKEVNEKINFTPKVFDINEAIEISANMRLEEEQRSDGLYQEREFTGLGATVGIGSGAALGAAVGSVVPILGTTIGAVVGGLAGLFAGATKNSVKERKKTVYKMSLEEVKREINFSAKKAIDKVKEDLNINMKAFIDGYKRQIYIEIDKFIDSLNKDLEQITGDYEKEKENKEKEIAYMAEIKLDMGQVLALVEQLK